MALSWNTKVLPRAELLTLLDGFVPVTDETFAHRVDQAIDREVVVVRKR
jgi:hypothetical protein